MQSRENKKRQDVSKLNVYYTLSHVSVFIVTLRTVQSVVNVAQNRIVTLQQTVTIG